jgi:hypothetical protein
VKNCRSSDFLPLKGVQRKYGKNKKLSSSNQQCSDESDFIGGNEFHECDGDTWFMSITIEK